MTKYDPAHPKQSQVFHVDIRVKPADGSEWEEGPAGVVKIALASRIDQEKANIERITDGLSTVSNPTYELKYRASRHLVSGDAT